MSGQIKFTVDLNSLTDEYGETLANIIKSEIESQCRAAVKKAVREQMKVTEAGLQKRLVKLSAGTLEALLKELDREAP